MTSWETFKQKPIRLKMNPYILVYLVCACGVVCAENFTRTNNAADNGSHIENSSPQHYESSTKDWRGLRMDYDQWKPLGRGDPLKNDPTYDYVPPVLEKVHYWVDSPLRKQDVQDKKSEILVLGVSSKKPSIPPLAVENRRDSYESFLKFIDGPKFHQHNHNAFPRPNGGQKPPQTLSSQIFKSNPEEMQRVPYTVLVPPPIPPPRLEMQHYKPKEEVVLQEPTHGTSEKPEHTQITAAEPSSTVSIQKSNIVYQLSSLDKTLGWQIHNNPTNLKNNTAENFNQIRFQDSPGNVNKIVFKENYLKASPSTTSHAYKLPVVFPTEKGKIVFEQHSTSSYPSNSLTNIPLDLIYTQRPAPQPVNKSPFPGPIQHIQHTTGPYFTAPPSSADKVNVHKGQVSDESIGDTYVNIGKPNAHIQQELTTDSSIQESLRVDVTTENSFLYGNNMTGTNIVYRPSTFPNYLGSTYYLHKKNPIAAINNLIAINNGYPGHRIRDQSVQNMQKMQPPPQVLTTESYQYISQKPSGFMNSLLKEETKLSLTTIPSTTATPTTTAGTSLTTDPLFKHYKQPTEPLKGPMYLIIQGHSKVKTYGPSHKQALNEIAMAENNEIPKSEKYPVKHLHNLKEMLEVNDKEYEQLQKSRSKNARTLKDLIADGIGKFDIKETELGAGFEVGDIETVSQKYHKGTVENDDTDIHELRKFAKIREKRQIEEFLPVVEDTVETFIYDSLKQQSEGSGIDALIASAITYDSSENEADNEISHNENEDDDDDDDDIL